MLSGGWGCDQAHLCEHNSGHKDLMWFLVLLPEVQKKWAASSWGRKLAVQDKRAKLGDFDRFKVMVAKVKVSHSQVDLQGLRFGSASSSPSGITAIVRLSCSGCKCLGKGNIRVVVVSDKSGRVIGEHGVRALADGTSWMITL